MHYYKLVCLSLPAASLIFVGKARSLFKCSLVEESPPSLDRKYLAKLASGDKRTSLLYFSIDDLQKKSFIA